MWCRKSFDLSWTGWACGLAYCCWRAKLEALAAQVEDLWSPKGNALACLSVRSGFDLLLDALDWPPGDELLFSAITIPDMPRIARAHGLMPVPVDLDPSTAAPNLDALRDAIGPRTRGLIVAHLFGGRVPLGPLIELCRRHGLWLIEDCAQAFDGRYHGDPRADASLFSFGVIKTSTALGGAVLVVRNPAVLDRMRRHLARQPVQSRWSYFRRLLKHGLLKVASTRLVFGALAAVSRWRGWDFDRFVNQSARGFAGGDFFAAIRKRPSVPLLAVMARRLAGFDFSHAARRRMLGSRLLAALQPAIECPGLDDPDHSFWVFPILCDKPGTMIDALRLAGFDAAQAYSLRVVEGQVPEADAPVARSLLERTVFVPLASEMSLSTVDRLAQTILAAGEVGQPPYPPMQARSNRFTRQRRDARITVPADTLPP